MEWTQVGTACVERVVADTVRGCVATGLMAPGAEIVSVFYRCETLGYPTPSLDRDAILGAVLPELRRRHVWSRGRFGAWKYEVANQDHSCMQGVEAVDAMLFGTPVRHWVICFSDLVALTVDCCVRDIRR